MITWATYRDAGHFEHFEVLIRSTREVRNRIVGKSQAATDRDSS